MSDLSDADWHMLSRAVQVLYQQCDLDAFAAVALNAVQRLIAADAIGYEECNVSARRLVGLMHPLDSRPKNNEVLEHHMAAHPLVVEWKARGGGRPVAVSDLVSREQWHRSPLYAQYYKSMSAEDQLGLLIGSERDSLICLAMNRSRRGFEARDYAILTWLAPHIRQAYQNAAGLSRLLGGRRPGDPSRNVTGWDIPALEIDRRGAILAINPTADALLRRAFPDWSRHPRQIPETLRRALAPAGDRTASHAAGPRMIEGNLAGVSVVPAVAEGRFVLLLRPHLADRDGQARADDTLPPRLRQVLDALLAGDSEKEAAVKLRLSRHTVHRYVTMLYRRLGVGSRGELMARYVDR